jgi:nucleoside phosphorylase
MQDGGAAKSLDQRGGTLYSRLQISIISPPVTRASQTTCVIRFDAKDKNCTTCAKDCPLDRPTRSDPLIHFDIVASGNKVIKNATERANIYVAHPGVLAVEMEAAGLMDVFGCATIQDICYYADSHKNDGRQKYASATAAAVAKEVPGIIQMVMVETNLPTAATG